MVWITPLGPGFAAAFDLAPGIRGFGFAIAFDFAPGGLLGAGSANCAGGGVAGGGSGGGPMSGVALANTSRNWWRLTLCCVKKLAT